MGEVEGARLPLGGMFSTQAHLSGVATVVEEEEEEEGGWWQEIVLDLASRGTTLLSGGIGRTADG